MKREEFETYARGPQAQVSLNALKNQFEHLEKAVVEAQLELDTHQETIREYQQDYSEAQSKQSAADIALSQTRQSIKNTSTYINDYKIRLTSLSQKPQLSLEWHLYQDDSKLVDSLISLNGVNQPANQNRAPAPDAVIALTDHPASIVTKTQAVSEVLASRFKDIQPFDHPDAEQKEQRACRQYENSSASYKNAERAVGEMDSCISYAQLMQSRSPHFYSVTVQGSPLDDCAQSDDLVKALTEDFELEKLRAISEKNRQKVAHKEIEKPLHKAFSTTRLKYRLEFEKQQKKLTVMCNPGYFGLLNAGCDLARKQEHYERQNEPIEEIHRKILTGHTKDSTKKMLRRHLIDRGMITDNVKWSGLLAGLYRARAGLISGVMIVLLLLVLGWESGTSRMIIGPESFLQPDHSTTFRATRTRERPTNFYFTDGEESGNYIVYDTFTWAIYLVIGWWLVFVTRGTLAHSLADPDPDPDPDPSLQWWKRKKTHFINRYSVLYVFSVVGLVLLGEYKYQSLDVASTWKEYEKKLVRGPVKPNRYMPHEFTPLQKVHSYDDYAEASKVAKGKKGGRFIIRCANAKQYGTLEATAEKFLVGLPDNTGNLDNNKSYNPDGYHIIDDDGTCVLVPGPTIAARDLRFQLQLFTSLVPLFLAFAWTFFSASILHSFGVAWTKYKLKSAMKGLLSGADQIARKGVSGNAPIQQRDSEMNGVPSDDGPDYPAGAANLDIESDNLVGKDDILSEAKRSRENYKSETKLSYRPNYSLKARLCALLIAFGLVVVILWAFLPSIIKGVN